MKRSNIIAVTMLIYCLMFLINCASSQVGTKTGLDKNFLQKARALSDSGNDQQAIVLYNELLQKSTEREQLYVLYHDRGISYAKIGDSRRAIEDFNRVIEINPNEPTLYYNRGLALKQMGDPRRAIEDYTKAIDLGIKNKVLRGTVYFERGRAYYDIHDIQRAKADFNEALDSGHKEAQKYLD